MNTEKLARGLGWFSIALGATEVVAADQLTRYFGIEERVGLVRAFGVREIAAGIGILVEEKPAPGVWARVGGDVLDLAALGMGLSTDNKKRNRVGAALGVIAAITILDAWCAQKLSEN